MLAYVREEPLINQDGFVAAFAEYLVSKAGPGTSLITGQALTQSLTEFVITKTAFDNLPRLKSLLPDVMTGVHSPQDPPTNDDRLGFLLRL